MPLCSPNMIQHLNQDDERDMVATSMHDVALKNSPQRILHEYMLKTGASENNCNSHPTASQIPAVIKKMFNCFCVASVTRTGAIVNLPDMRAFMGEEPMINDPP